MGLAERLRRVPYGAWAALFAVAITLPGLGSFGFWEPWELGRASHARAMAEAGRFFDTTVKGRYGAEPPLDLGLAAIGVKVFGARELGARFGNALAALLALFAVYHAGGGLFRRRAALLSVLVLGTMPLFLLQARQLVSDMPLVAGQALALGGLARYAWPGDGRRRARDLALAAAGLALGFLSGGGLLGVAIPALAVTGAVLVGLGLRPTPVAGDEPALLERGVGPDVPENQSLGRALIGGGVRAWVPLALVALVGIACLVAPFVVGNVAGKFSLLLGGIPRGGVPAQKFDYLLRQIGFGLFPWSAVAIFALGSAFLRVRDDDEHGGGRTAFVWMHLMLFATFAFAIASLFGLQTGSARFPALAAVALAAGAFLDEALERRRGEPVLGLIVAAGTVIVARDFFQGPEEIVSTHLLDKVKWPPTVVVGPAVLALGLIVAAGFYAGFAGGGLRAPGDGAAPLPGWRRWPRAALRLGARAGLPLAIVGAIAAALGLIFVLLPALSKHYSFKPVLESYTRFARGDEEIGRYRVEGHGADFYASRRMTELASQDQVLAFLRRPERVFTLIASDALAALDSACKQGNIPYFVLDASSSRFLLLSNRLQDGEADENPLKKNVWTAPAPPERTSVPGSNEVIYDWRGHKPPWTWRVPLATTFGGCIELVGADYPESVRRPAKIPVSLIFRINCRPPSGYKVFMHFDSPGAPRVLGDHDPLGGAFPMVHWLPGEYLRDTFEVDAPLMTTTAATYNILVGFWPGGDGKRIPITAGPNDGADRASIGNIVIR